MGDARPAEGLGRDPVGLHAGWMTAWGGPGGTQEALPNRDAMGPLGFRKGHGSLSSGSRRQWRQAWGGRWPAPGLANGGGLGPATPAGLGPGRRAGGACCGLAPGPAPPHPRRAPALPARPPRRSSSCSPVAACRRGLAGPAQSAARSIRVGEGRRRGWTWLCQVSPEWVRGQVLTSGPTPRRGADPLSGHPQRELGWG